MLDIQDNLSWANLVITNLLDEDLITIFGLGSKESHVTRIVITQHGAGSGR